MEIITVEVNKDRLYIPNMALWERNSCYTEIGLKQSIRLGNIKELEDLVASEKGSQPCVINEPPVKPFTAVEAAGYKSWKRFHKESTIFTILFKDRTKVIVKPKGKGPDINEEYEVSDNPAAIAQFIHDYISEERGEG